MNKTFLLTFVPGPNYQADKSFHDQPCLLYTSDAADERSSVDLGGRRIIKKKKKNKKRRTTKEDRKYVLR